MVDIKLMFLAVSTFVSLICLRLECESTQMLRMSELDVRFSCFAIHIRYRT